MSSSRCGSDTGERLTFVQRAACRSGYAQALCTMEKFGIFAFALGIAFIVGGAVLIWWVVTTISG